MRPTQGVQRACCPPLQLLGCLAVGEEALLTPGNSTGAVSRASGGQISFQP